MSKPTQESRWPINLSKAEARICSGLHEQFDDLDDKDCIPFKRVVLPATPDSPARLSEKLYRLKDLEQWSESLEGNAVSVATRNYKQHLRSLGTLSTPEENP